MNTMATSARVLDHKHLTVFGLVTDRLRERNIAG